MLSQWKVCCSWHLVGGDQDAAKDPTTHRTVPRTRRGQAPSVSGAEVVGPAPDLCCRAWFSLLPAPPFLGFLLTCLFSCSLRCCLFHPEPSKSMLCHWLHSAAASPSGTFPLASVAIALTRMTPRALLLCPSSNFQMASPIPSWISLWDVHCHLTPHTPNSEPISMPCPPRTSSLPVPFCPASFGWAQKPQAFWACLLHRQPWTTRHHATLPL